MPTFVGKRLQLSKSTWNLLFEVSLCLFPKPEKSATKQAQCIVLPNPGPLCKYFPSSSLPLDVTQWHRRSSQFCSQAQEGMFIVLRASFNFTISNCYFLFVCLFPNTNKQFWSQMSQVSKRGAGEFQGHLTFIYLLEKLFCCSDSLFLRTRRNDISRRHKPATQGRINKLYKNCVYKSILCLCPHFRFNKNSHTAVWGMREEDKVIFLCQVKVAWRGLIFFIVILYFSLFCTINSILYSSCCDCI